MPKMPGDGRGNALVTAAALTSLLFLLRLTITPVSATRFGRPVAAAFTPSAGGATKTGGIRDDGRRRKRFGAAGPPTVEETDGGRATSSSGEEFGDVNRDGGVKRTADDAPPGNEVDVFGRPLVSDSNYEGISSSGNSIASGYLASLKFLEEEVIEQGEYTRLALLKRMQGTKKAANEVIDQVSLSEWRAPSFRWKWRVQRANETTEEKRRKILNTSMKKHPTTDVAQKAAKELDDTVRNISLSDALDGVDTPSAEPAVVVAADANSTAFELPHL